jgi:hypothetical protein
LSLVLCWVSGRADVPGNEAHDAAAKEAATEVQKCAQVLATDHSEVCLAVALQSCIRKSEGID